MKTHMQKLTNVTFGCHIFDIIIVIKTQAIFVISEGTIEAYQSKFQTKRTLGLITSSNTQRSKLVCKSLE